MARNINRVIITGNLTADPELRAAGSTTVCRLRVAVNGVRKDPSGNWIEKPNYFDVDVFGAQGENCANYLSKGRPVAIDGRLDWSEWEAKDGSGKRQKVQIVADSVQFLGSRDGGGGNGGAAAPAAAPAAAGTETGFTPPSDVPADTSDFQEPASVGSSASASDDDIPF